MSIQDLSAMASVLLALSLATERLVAIVKTIAPGWFATEQKGPTGEADLMLDRWRRLRVQAVAFVAGWGSAAFLASDGTGQGGWDLFGHVDFGTLTLPVLLVGILATGGSAFWAQVVGYSSAMKDVAAAQKASSSLEVSQQAAGKGVTAAGRVIGAGQKATTVAEAMETLRKQPPQSATDPVPASNPA